MMAEADPASDWPPEMQRYFARENDAATFGERVCSRAGFQIRSEVEFQAWRQVTHLVAGIIASHALTATGSKPLKPRGEHLPHGDRACLPPERHWTR
jgi:hypothetical protein